MNQSIQSTYHVTTAFGLPALGAVFSKITSAVLYIRSACETVRSSGDYYILLLLFTHYLTLSLTIPRCCFSWSRFCCLFLFFCFLLFFACSWCLVGDTQRRAWPSRRGTAGASPGPPWSTSPRTSAPSSPSSASPPPPTRGCSRRSVSVVSLF